MKYFISLLFCLSSALLLQAQQTNVSAADQQAITSLIDCYSEAREKRDTALLKFILMEDVDQLVSTGEWRTGLRAAIDGMQKSSANKPGTRTLAIDKIRMLTSTCVLADCRYEIVDTDGSVRKMWSSFVMVHNKKTWKIAAIRNMLPAGND